MDEDNKISPKVSGYLEKKGKMKMMSSYKKYWFVLEGRLLLYYRSKVEYEAISPCKGSINLGPPCNVKPCSSTHGVFQIETRTTTITLRAENQDDQNRWMQGIMSALNQNKNSTKLGHFRYSLNELPHEHVIKDELKRQNSIPRSTDSPQILLNKEIIKRLQKMGAQSYGGSVETMDVRRRKMSFENNICKQMARVSAESINGNESISYHTPNKKTEENKKNKLPNVPVGCENNVFLRKIDPDAETLDRPTTFLLENEVYHTPRHITPHQNKTRDNILDTIADRPSTFLLQNEIYATTNTITTQCEGRDTNLILENLHYPSAKKVRVLNSSAENIYSEPKCSKLTDHNENNVLLNNSHQVANREVNPYSVFELYDPKKQIGTANSTNKYEYIENVEYAELKDKIEDHNNDGTANECYPKSKSILKKDKNIKMNKIMKDTDVKKNKLKKKSSFIRRVWKKKSKLKEASDNDENLYETVPVETVEKGCINDDTAIQMLSELYNILENKKPILSEQLPGGLNSKHSGEKTEEKKGTPSGNVNNTSGNVTSNSPSSPTNEETAVQMLTELQNILETKKNVLTARMSIDNDEIKTDEKKIEKNKTLSTSQGKNSNVESNSTDSEPEIAYPLVPPKNKKTNIDSPYHNFPKNNKPINVTLPPKIKQNLENVKSLDEILNDLDMQKMEDSRKNKVKKLIKRFNDTYFNEDDVVLRINKKDEDYSRKDIDSDELNRLLNDLAKVTSAPILTPGATTSLISPNLLDEEVLDLVPKHRRRYSEPDYDIPRPHKSLTNLPKKETPAESVIESTRFFGPILNPCDISIKSNNIIRIPSEDIPSMTPDSLEVEAQAIYPHLSYLSEDEKNYSYTSHNYGKFKNVSTRNQEDLIKQKNMSTNIDNSIKRFDSIIIENDIYAEPKSLHNINTAKEYKINNSDNNLFFENNQHLDIEFDEENAKEFYVDSLET